MYEGSLPSLEVVLARRASQYPVPGHALSPDVPSPSLFEENPGFCLMLFFPPVSEKCAWAAEVNLHQEIEGFRHCLSVV